MASDSKKAKFLSHLTSVGGTSSNNKLIKALHWSEKTYASAKLSLLQEKRISQGPGGQIKIIGKIKRSTAFEAKAKNDNVETSVSTNDKHFLKENFKLQKLKDEIKRLKKENQSFVAKLEQLEYELQKQFENVMLLREQLRAAQARNPSIPTFDANLRQALESQIKEKNEQIKKLKSTVERLQTEIRTSKSGAEDFKT